MDKKISDTTSLAEKPEQDKGPPQPCSTDLGKVIVDPFQTVLNQDARPVKQKTYCHSLFFAANVRTKIDKLLLAEILYRSYSIWASLFVLVAKSNGRIRLTCNYKTINEQSVIPVLPFLVVDNLL